MPCSLCHPRAEELGGIGAKLHTGRDGCGGFTFLTGQMFAFFPPKHLLPCSILGSGEQCFEGSTGVTGGCQPHPSEAIVGFLAVLAFRLTEEMCGGGVFYLMDA